ncbi:hypothetical protein CHLNCDRAFT_135473 [Chlorella variabilis]|uniref:Ketoreductase domain-containing protein n=1 Tax=Chlorella variabilis TaxID=554065 RepID=E1ZI91_CHLVA|nr:hypothetical protein CHLNCDRAFT_135473 [Chlorella variabilis]EFN54113.1 hypothetical protein CHLNCDRAFT_135473 [Chlorella variabilis]|eukprot:XP_005846215.1 hypothetical protein CHLNCDRAFT_135473 [Chlorella variabilis]
MADKKLLQGKTVLITGASRGVGETLSCHLARHGAKLVLVSEKGDDLKQTQEKCQAEGAPDVDTHSCDLADPKAVQTLGEKLAGQGVDVAIMNAGVFVGGEDDPLKGNPDEWDRMFRINVAAPMRLMRLLAPGMKDKGEGCIVCISDVEAVHTGPRHAAYAASKSAYEASYQPFEWQAAPVLGRLSTLHLLLCKRAGNVAQTSMAEETGKQGGQGAIDPHDVSEAVLLAFRCSANCVPEEIVLKAARPQ